MLQTLGGDLHILGDLHAHGVPHILHIQAVGEFHDLLNGQAGLVGEVFFGGLGHGQFQNGLVVLLDQHDVGMVVGNAQADHILAVVDEQVDIKDQLGIGGLDLQIHGLHVGLDFGMLLLGNLGDDLQFLVRIAADDTGAEGSSHAVESAGVGDHHALDVLDDVAADPQTDLVGGGTQDGPGLGGSIGHGNGFGAAHGRPQLLTEDG